VAEGLHQKTRITRKVAEEIFRAADSFELERRLCCRGWTRGRSRLSCGSSGLSCSGRSWLSAWSRRRRSACFGKGAWRCWSGRSRCCARRGWHRAWRSRSNRRAGRGRVHRSPRHRGRTGRRGRGVPWRRGGTRRLRACLGGAEAGEAAENEGCSKLVEFHGALLHPVGWHEGGHWSNQVFMWRSRGALPPT
jgi:hypothetical protein